jgi:hypothetical protein
MHTIKNSRFIGMVEDGQKVVFKSPDSRNFPLPDRRYLTLHVAIAKVVHMAGMAVS